MLDSRLHLSPRLKTRPLSRILHRFIHSIIPQQYPWCPHQFRTEPLSSPLQRGRSQTQRLHHLPRRKGQKIKPNRQPREHEKYQRCPLVSIFLSNANILLCFLLVFSDVPFGPTCQSPRNSISWLSACNFFSAFAARILMFDMAKRMTVSRRGYNAKKRQEAANIAAQNGMSRFPFKHRECISCA